MGAGRLVGGGLAALAGAVAVASCVATDYSNCDYVVTRCHTVCDTWCDFWGCYPVCYDQCWDECYVTYARPAPPPPALPPPAVRTDGGPAPVVDAASPPPSDASGASGDGGGAICSACRANDECSAGALCIVPGGEAGADAGAGFCGQSCTGSGATSNCPAGFACSAIGSSLQCLPLSGSCP